MRVLKRVVDARDDVPEFVDFAGIKNVVDFLATLLPMVSGNMLVMVPDAYDMHRVEGALRTSTVSQAYARGRVRFLPVSALFLHIEDVDFVAQFKTIVWFGFSDFEIEIYSDDDRVTQRYSKQKRIFVRGAPLEDCCLCLGPCERCFNDEVLKVSSPLIEADYIGFLENYAADASNGSTHDVKMPPGCTLADPFGGGGSYLALYPYDRWGETLRRFHYKTEIPVRLLRKDMANMSRVIPVSLTKQGRRMHLSFSSRASLSPRGILASVDIGEPPYQDEPSIGCVLTSVADDDVTDYLDYLQVGTTLGWELALRAYRGREFGTIDEPMGRGGCFLRLFKVAYRALILQIARKFGTVVMTVEFARDIASVIDPSWFVDEPIFYTFVGTTVHVSENHGRRENARILFEKFTADHEQIVFVPRVPLETSSSPEGSVVVERVKRPRPLGHVIVRARGLETAEFSDATIQTPAVTKFLDMVERIFIKYQVSLVPMNKVRDAIVKLSVGNKSMKRDAWRAVETNLPKVFNLLVNTQPAFDALLRKRERYVDMFWLVDEDSATDDSSEND